MARLGAAQRALLEDIVGLQEIADRLDVSRKVAWNWADRDWTGFPAPVLTLAAGRFWRWSEVKAWHDKNRSSEK